jgi:hypothetical protein
MYEFHELANIVPLSSKKELEALTYDISVNGQIEKALVWQSKIIDGRNRSIACENLGLELKVEILPDEMTYEEIFNLVMSKNNRRSLSPTQKAISAYNSYKETKRIHKKMTTSLIAKMWGISETSLESVIFIVKHQPDFVDALFDGNKVKIADISTGEIVTTTSINRLATIIRSNIKNGIVVENDHSAKPKNYTNFSFVNEEAYEWYIHTYSLLKNDEDKVNGIVVEYANMKFGGTGK